MPVYVYFLRAMKKMKEFSEKNDKFFYTKIRCQQDFEL